MTPALRGRLRQLAGQWKRRKLPPASVDIPDQWARLEWDGEKIDVTQRAHGGARRARHDAGYAGPVDFERVPRGDWRPAANMVLTAYLDCFTHIGLLAIAVETAAREREAAERADREACRDAALRVHAALDAIGCPKAGEEP